jgi:hypothetical protein
MPVRTRAAWSASRLFSLALGPRALAHTRQICFIIIRSYHDRDHACAHEQRTQRSIDLIVIYATPGYFHTEVLACKHHTAKQHHHPTHDVHGKLIQMANTNIASQTSKNIVFIL